MIQFLNMLASGSKVTGATSTIVRKGCSSLRWRWKSGPSTFISQIGNGGGGSTVPNLTFDNVVVSDVHGDVATSQAALI